MKATLLIFAMVAAFPSAAQQSVVPAPIAKALRKAANKPTGKFTPSDLKKIKQLDLSDKGLSDIRALAGLSELEILWLGNNKIANLSLLRFHSKLKRLRIDGNQLSSIKTLPKLDQLEALYVDNNQIRDLSPILKLKNLNLLSAGGYNQNDFDTILKLNDLEGLGLSGNNLSNQQLATVANELPKLKFLAVCYNPELSNLLPLATLKNLVLIDVDDRPNLRIQIKTLQKTLPKLQARYIKP